jgi:hypothetical protein
VRRKRTKGIWREKKGWVLKGTLRQYLIDRVTAKNGGTVGRIEKALIKQCRD